MDARLIDIPIESKNANKYSLFIQDLQKRISPDDMALQLVSDNLHASLVALDLDGFTKSVEELSREHDIKKSGNPFYSLIKEIESIKDRKSVV